MTGTRTSPRIAINVMRARLTVVAFNLAIVSLQLAVLPRLPGAVELPGSSLSLHLSTDITLLIGLALSVISLVLFIASSEFDEQGTCTHWGLVAGDLFMYLGLAHSVSGFFAPFSVLLQQSTLQGVGLLHTGLVVTGGAAWFLATYLGPVVSLRRSPFSPAVNRGLWTGYVLLLLFVAAVAGQAERLHAQQVGAEPPGAVSATLGELVQPLHW